VLLLNHWALDGDWLVGPEKITTQKTKTGLRLNFYARKVFLVLGPATDKSIHIHVMLNGKPAGSMSGADVKGDELIVDHERLYELIDQKTAQNGVLDLQADEPGLEAYAFTFGD
jgi:hypothetical protein